MIHSPYYTTIHSTVYRDYHSGVVTTKREKQGQLGMDDEPSMMKETTQEQTNLDDLAGFQTEHSAKRAIVKGDRILLLYTTIS